MFRDRADAGRQLALALERFKALGPVVLALPRGGVPVGFEIAKALEAPLDLVLVRKIGAPGEPELAVAAIVDGDRPETVYNRDVMAELGLTEAYVKQAAIAEFAEIERRRRAYLGDRPRVDAAGRAAIVVDDGIATGATMRAALVATRRANPSRLVLAVPTAPRETIEALKSDVDEVVCLEMPSRFLAISMGYQVFPQLGDDEVRELLARAAAAK